VQIEQTDIKHGLHEGESGRGGRADKSFLLTRGRRSPYAAGSRPVVPFRDAWVQIGRALETYYENPNPGALNSKSAGKLNIIANPVSHRFVKIAIKELQFKNCVFNELIYRGDNNGQIS
jgi:hypothetical protein